MQNLLQRSLLVSVIKAEIKKNKMPLKVIGSGLGRTGTYSLKLALELLGFGKCYHMIELYQNPAGVKYFKTAEKGGVVNWEELFQGYNSAVDYPVARYYKQLSEYYPYAKIIHTIRNPDDWYDSASETIIPASNPVSWKMIRLSPNLIFSAQARKRFPVFFYNTKLAKLEFGKRPITRESAVKKFNEHTEEVIRNIPEERLLIFNPKDGWNKLCKFLNVPVPDSEFPKSNTRDEFLNKVNVIARGKSL